MEEQKRRDFVLDLEVLTLVCSPSVGNALRLLPSYNLPSGEPTHMNLPYKKETIVLARKPHN
jgi:hypothetical protein